MYCGLCIILDRLGIIIMRGVGTQYVTHAYTCTLVTILTERRPLAGCVIAHAYMRMRRYILAARIPIFPPKNWWGRFEMALKVILLSFLVVAFAASCNGKSPFGTRPAVVLLFLSSCRLLQQLPVRVRQWRVRG